jgi:dolichol-phosphate mannosyltransferase
MGGPVIWVVFPAWNEDRVIRATLLELWRTYRGSERACTAVLVDDGSSDRTVDEAMAAVADSGGALALEVLRHPGNRGLGAALRTGLYWVLDRAADDDVVVTLDADATHPPALIPDLVRQIEQGADLAIASRYRPGAEVLGVPALRRALSDAARLVFTLLYPIPGVRDYTCCFRAHAVPLLRRARAAYGDGLCSARGFEAVMDLLLRLGSLGITVREIPFRLDYRGRVGRSKMRVLRTVRSTLGLLLLRRWERLTTDSPRARAAREAAAARGGPA